MTKRIAIDIDGTIFTEKRESERMLALPIEGAVESVNYLYEIGYTIILYTARTYRELEITLKQLKDNKVKYHHLVLGKPVADVFIDDRAVVMTNWADAVKATTNRFNHPLRAITVMVSSAGSTNGVNVIKALQGQSDYTIRIIAVDSNANASGLYLAGCYEVIPQTYNHLYPQAISNICKRHKVDIAMPSHSSELPFYSTHQELFSELGVKVMVSAIDSLDVCNDKELTSKFLGLNSVRHPETYQVSDDITFPVFIKSRFGSGSTYARRIDDRSSLKFYYKNIPSPIIQEYIDGAEYTVNVLSGYDGKVVGAIPIRRVRIRGGLSVEAQAELNTDITEGCKTLVEKLGLVGASNVQVMKKGDEIVYIEINPRFASGTLPLAVGAGFNIPLLMVKLMLGEPVGRIAIQDKVKMTRYMDYIIRDGT